MAIGLAIIMGMLGLAAIASAAETPTITGAIKTSGGATTISAVVGSSVYASVVVASSTASTSPTGTVDFNLYTTQNCTGSPVTQTGRQLIGGIATSSTTTVAMGGLSYKAHYNGQGDLYAPADSSCLPLAAVQPGTPGTISGTVFNDLNKNGTQDSGEPGLSGWKVRVHQKATTTAKWAKKNGKKFNYGSPVIQTTTTDSNGNYVFANLIPGTYFVEQEEPKGWDQRSHDRTVTINDRTPSADVDFANIEKKEKKHDDDEDDDHGRGGRDNGRSNWTKEDWQNWWTGLFNKWWEKKENKNK